MKKVRLLISLLFFSTFCISQAQIHTDSIKFEPLKEYVGKAQDELVLSLDSIFRKDRKILRIDNSSTAQNIPYFNDGSYSFIRLGRKCNFYLDPKCSYKLIKEKPDSGVYNFMNPNKDRNFYILHNVYIDSLQDVSHNKLELRNSIVENNLIGSDYKLSIIANLDFFNYESISSKKFDSIVNISNSFVGRIRTYEKFDKVNREGVEEYTMPDRASIKSFNIKDSKINYIFLDSLAPKNLSIQTPYTSKRFTIKDAVCNGYVVDNKWNSIEVKDTNFKKSLEFRKTSDTLVLVNVSSPKIHIFQREKKKGEKSKIFLYNIDYDNLETHWLGYELFKPDSIWTDDHINSTYLSLIAHFRKKGYAESLEAVDKEYRKWKLKNEGKTFYSWINEVWWDFGYSKEKIFRNTLLILLFFSFINTFLIIPMSSNLYLDKKIFNLVLQNRKRNFIIRFFLNFLPSVFYTAQFFLGIKFAIERLKYSDKLNNWKIFGILYFFLIYLSGLICIGYLVNTVIGKV